MLCLGFSVRESFAGEGQLNNANVNAAWSWNSSFSSASSYSKKYGHYALAVQDGNRALDNRPGGLHASASIHGNSALLDDYAAAGLGYR